MKFNLKTINNQLVISSKHIAEQFERKHSDVMASIRKVITAREISRSDYTDKSGKSSPMIYLNERQALKVMPFIGGVKSIEGQSLLVDAFFDLREALNNQNTKTPKTPLELAIEQVAIQQALEDSNNLHAINKPKVEYATQVELDDMDMQMSQYIKNIMKNTDVKPLPGRNKLFKYLRQARYLQSSGKVLNEAYQKHIDSGLFKSFQHTGTNEITTYITAYGQQYLAPEIKSYFVKDYLTQQDIKALQKVTRKQTKIKARIEANTPLKFKEMFK